MIELFLKTPKNNTVIFADTISINYEVRDTDGVFDKVVFEVFDKNHPETAQLLLRKKSIGNKITNNINGLLIEQETGLLSTIPAPSDARLFYAEKTIRTEIFQVPSLKEGDYIIYCVLKNKYGKTLPNTEKIVNFSTKPITLEIKNKLSSVVENCVPEFLRTDYTFFTDFVKYYYKWLESTKNVNYIPHSLEQYLDIDNIPPELIDTFYETYLSNFPREFTKDKETNSNIDVSKILKRIKNFYSKKGTEDSFRFLFRVMFDTEITFSYPREKILYASQGKWKTPYLIRAKNLERDQIIDLIGTEIYVNNQNGERTFSAIIDDAYSTVYNGTITHNLYLIDIIGSLNQDTVYYDQNVFGINESTPIKLCSMIINTDWVDCPGSLPTFISSDVSNIFEPRSSKKFGFKVGEKLFLKLIPDNLQISCVPPEGCENSPADLNNDGVVTGADLGIVLGAFGTNPGHPADYNGDGKVSGSDLGIFLGYYSGCSPCNSIYQQTEFVGILGTGFYSIVDEVNDFGQIIKINIIDPGINYTEENITRYNTEIIKQNGSTELYNCRLLYKFGYLFQGKSYYEDSLSVLGFTSVLQDNYYYQTHSYEIGSGITSFKFSDILKQTAHPAGYLPFYKYDILDVITEKPITTFNYNQSNSFADSLSTILDSQINNEVIPNINAINIQTVITDGIETNQYVNSLKVNKEERNDYLVNYLLRFTTDNEQTDN